MHKGHQWPQILAVKEDSKGGAMDNLSSKWKMTCRENFLMFMLKITQKLEFINIFHNFFDSSSCK